MLSLKEESIVDRQLAHATSSAVSAGVTAALTASILRRADAPPGVA